MTELRAAKVAGIAQDIPPLEVDVGEHDPANPPKVLVVGWGSTYGPIRAAVRRVRQQGMKVARTHLRHLNPFPANTGDVLASYERILVPEMNLGQLRMLLRAEYLADVRGYNKVTGLPFTSRELAAAITEQVVDVQAAEEPVPSMDPSRQGVRHR
jgi:2-oxoglutarate ferredoxin oxidoreductase subunit alpha